MSFLDRSSPDPVSVARSGDDVETLLRRFFQAEMPSPWPKLEPPADGSPKAVAVRWRGWALLRSRLSLAACVALFVAAELFLSGSFQTQRDTKGTDIALKPGSNRPQDQVRSQARPADRAPTAPHTGN